MLILPACTMGDVFGPGLEDSLRRLMTVSSQRAFAGLLRENGFFEDELARVELPPQLGGSGATTAASALLRQPAVQNQLLRLVNAAAAQAAANAAPIVYDSIRTLSITDGLGIVRGGPTAATDYLRQAIGDRIVAAMLPGIGNALRTQQAGLLGQALAAGAGIDLPGLQHDLTSRAASGIWRAIGREERAIRADPSSAGDPLIARLFGP